MVDTWVLRFGPWVQSLRSYIWLVGVKGITMVISTSSDHSQGQLIYSGYKCAHEESFGLFSEQSEESEPVG